MFEDFEIDYEFPNTRTMFQDGELEDFPVVTGRGWGKGEYIQRRNVITDTTESQITVCDWNLLALCSPVIEAWTRWEPDIMSSGNEVLSFFSNDEDAITQLTEYMQGRRIKVTNEDLYELLSLADMLQVDDVSNYCKHRLASLELNKDNYHKILNACSVYSFEHEQMDQFIRGNLTELCEESGILAISPDTVEWLLTDKELSYWPMADRFVFITDWCNAHEGRTVYFEKWFGHLDFDKIDKDIIQGVVKNENLVRRSAKCLSKVNVYLCDRNEAPVPFVFTLNDIRTGSNTIGFNMEDKQLYRFKFPDRMMKSTSVTTVRESGKIVSFDHTQRCIYEYDINTNVEKNKNVLSQEKFPDDITHMLDANDRLILICKPQKVQYWNNFSRKNSRLKRGSVLYQLVNDDGATLEIEPLLSLTFEVSCACLLHSSIIMSTTTYSKRSKLFSFNLRTNQLIEMDLDLDRSYGIQPLIKCLLPIHGKLLLTLQSKLLLLSLNEEKRTYCIQDRYNTDVNTITYGNPRYIFFSDFIIELNSKNIRLCYSSKDENDIQNWFSYELNRLNFDHAKPVLCTYIKRTRPFCHIMCPHCDPYAWQKEEEALKLQESLENRYHSDYYDRDYYDDDYDDDYGYNDDDYGYNDDPWNQRELIWDGSADEFVEAWW